ncbi:hypothetical protein BDW62DRAFT_176023 [Aspergillus aurantiobrunneus]
MEERGNCQPQMLVSCLNSSGSIPVDLLLSLVAEAMNLNTRDPQRLNLLIQLSPESRSCF